jgi:hypothetical protein
MSRIQPVFERIHECGAQPETKNGHVSAHPAESSAVNRARLDFRRGESGT